MTDSSLHGSHAPRPAKNKARPGDLIIPFTCPDCGKEHYVWVDVQRLPEFERDEIGQVKRDSEGNPIEKVTITHSYISVPRLHPAWNPEMEEELKILYERSKAEREYAAKNKASKLLAEIAA